VIIDCGNVYTGAARNFPYRSGPKSMTSKYLTGSLEQPAPSVQASFRYFVHLKIPSGQAVPPADFRYLYTHF
jgi:hypothetical protein